jgi:hypothetical protein
MKAFPIVDDGHEVLVHREREQRTRTVRLFGVTKNAMFMAPPPASAFRCPLGWSGARGV